MVTNVSFNLYMLLLTMWLYTVPLLIKLMCIYLFLSLDICMKFHMVLTLFYIEREIEKEEFKKVMAMMRAHNRQGANHRDGLRTGLKVGGSVEDGGLVEYFFGEDGNKRLQHNEFIQFLDDRSN